MSLERDVGKLQGTVESLEKTVVDLSTTITALQGQVTFLSEQLAAAKGGWKVITYVAAASSVASSGIAWIISHWK